MPRIFDNIAQPLLPALRDTLTVSHRSDFCVGYFNLRGWKAIDALIEQWPGGPDNQCRLLVGMQRLPQDELREAYRLSPGDSEMSMQVAVQLKRRLAQTFRDQLTFGAPTDADETGLRRLSAQLKAGKVVVKLFLRHTLHAKLYLCFRSDPNNPITGFLGSSNLTFSGLKGQGELNVDVLDHDATEKLASWFNDRWNDHWCVDITRELIEVIDESWARPDVLPPYWIYIKMAYHLAEEARAGLSEFNIPPDLRGELSDFQSAAVRIAARHLQKRGGVILGDVVGFGKTRMATALARVFQDPPHSLETLILCPKNLKGMWEDYAHRYRLIAKVVSVTQAQNELPDLRRYRVVIIDESHNLRNREGRRWAVIRDYLSRNASKCILLSATPYNKTYLDLANQLRLFLTPEDTVGIRPEVYLRNDCDSRVDEFTRRHQCPVNCLAAFEKSPHPDDWRELMRLFMVRRTRSFVERNYAYTECPVCTSVLTATQTNCPKCERAKAKEDRRFLILGDGKRFHFPKRQPKALHFHIRDNDPDDQYARLYSPQVVDTSRQKLTLRVDAQDHVMAAFAEKRGFTAWLCVASASQLPDRATRLKLERKLTETSFEHLIVFTTPDRSRQSWMWVRRETGKPLAVRTHEFSREQPGDSLLQKLDALCISFEEEEQGITIAQVAGRARAAFDLERVTKVFYRDFDTHRKAFLKFIDGIGELADREWYASVMLNRMMFVYFIQKKGFLDGDRDYLRHRLQLSQREKGKDKFYSFYRYFLLRLFHEGFGKRRKDRAPDLEKLLGNIPYLNGGLFDVHELEKPERYGEEIQIPDKAFERVFDYFDAYQWHLDERPLRADNEINPDVLGYIFEKYINQKQMGAYYTKEDITDYIGKNTILPFLFDVARSKCKVAFENPAGPTVWDLLRESPDRYIYPAVRHGTDKKIPPEIAAGLDPVQPDLIARRKAWNKPAPADYALPTEIWREVVARRQRCEEIKKKLTAGEILDVKDFITLNLDLRQFAQDVIQSCEGPDLLMALWHAVTTITVLDPTGGSGAFVFAALNILDPLYEACLDRMDAFLAEWGEQGRKAHPNYHKKFTEVLARVDAHPNRRYFVLKSIILNNLYAVDIMEEAVEICKLRLFLKLAAQVEPDVTKDNLGIEPLPDVDFNIRAGNTLVGYATSDKVSQSMTAEKTKGADQMKLMGEDELSGFLRFNTRCADVEQAFAKFRQLQTEGDGSVPVAHKQELQKRLKSLEDELNRHLASEYGVKVSDKVAYAKWLKSHQPFHWFIQFYGIITSGGFDVIIGNPPYVEYSKVRGDYTLHLEYATLPCGNIYTCLVERSFALARKDGRLGLIVPLSLVCTSRTEELREAIHGYPCWISSYDMRPSSLFEGVAQRLSVLIGQKQSGVESATFTGGYRRWSAEERPTLIPLTRYIRPGTRSLRGPVPKLDTEIEARVLMKISAPLLERYSRDTGPVMYVHRIVRYFVKALDFLPVFRDARGKPGKSEDYKAFHFVSDEQPQIAALLNSTLFYWFWRSHCDGFHCGYNDVFSMPFSPVTDVDHRKTLAQLGAKLMKELQNTSVVKKIKTQAGHITYQEFYAGSTKPILDEIDTVLAEHYGFTPEELDFIINYDIKYRLGRGTGSEEE